MKAAKFIHWLMLGLVVVCTGCSQEVHLLWFNNSGDGITIYQGLRSSPEKVVIASGQSAIFHPSGMFKIERGSKVNVYEPLKVNRSMASKGRFRTINVQIEADGAIVFLGPQATGIITNLPPQPQGFPARPK